MLDLRLALPDDVQHQLVGLKPVFTKCVNPEHHDRKRPNMAVYVDGLHCFACGFRLGCDGTCAERGASDHTPRCREWQLQALAALLGTTEREVVQVAQRYTNERLDAYRERAEAEARRDPMPLAIAQAYHQLLLGPRIHRYQWLSDRCLSDDIIDQALIGHNGFQFTIPIRDRDGNLLTMRLRRDDEYGAKRPKYMGLAGRNGFYLYPEPWLWQWKPSTLVICEGELDALVLWQDGIPAVSATNGARQVPKIPAVLAEHYPFVQRVLLATDQDEPGQEAARLTVEAAQQVGLQAEVLTWPEENKDVSELRQHDAATFHTTFAC